MLILAQAAEVKGAVETVQILQNLGPLGVALLFCLVIGGFLWKRQQKLEVRIESLEGTCSRTYGFVQAVVGASQASESVPSSVIHKLYDQHKPSDASGEHRPIRF